MGIKGGLSWSHILNKQDIIEIKKIFCGTSNNEIEDLLAYMSTCACGVPARDCSASPDNNNNNTNGGNGNTGKLDPACVQKFLDSHCSDKDKERYATWVAVLSSLLTMPSVNKYPAVKGAVKALIYAFTALALACESHTLTNDAMAVLCWIGTFGRNILQSIPLIGAMLIDLDTWLDKDGGLSWIQSCCNDAGATQTSVSGIMVPTSWSSDTDINSWLNDLTSALPAQAAALSADMAPPPAK